LDLSCWFGTADTDRFAESRTALLLAVLEIIESFNAFIVPPKK